MSQYISDITSLSSKGQVVLPISIRKGMNIQAGAKLIVISDGENILLKPIVEPDITEVRSMMDSAMPVCALVSVMTSVKRSLSLCKYMI